MAGSENASFKLLRSGEDMECGTSVPLSNAAKPPSRGNGSLNDQVYRLAKAEGKGGSAADQGDTGVPHSKDLATKDRRIVRLQYFNNG